MLILIGGEESIVMDVMYIYFFLEKKYSWNNPNLDLVLIALIFEKKSTSVFL